MVSVTLAQPWLQVDFPCPMRSLGWTPQQGRAEAVKTVLWRQVRDEDLSEDFDVLPWLGAQTQSLGLGDVPCFLTSARIEDYEHVEICVDGICVHAVVTLGLGNAERIGQRRAHRAAFGTINTLLVVGCGLTDAAALEAMSLVVEARTTAMLDFAPTLGAVRMTGTGTDCVCLCMPNAQDADAHLYAGKHTALGEAIGRACYDAFRAAILRWQPSR